MSLETLRPYFKDRMVVVDPELREWEDPFNLENIPNPELGSAYHIEIGDGSLVSFNQNCLVVMVPINLTAWVKGFRTPVEAVDSGHKKVEAIIKECCRHSKRLTQPFIKNVVPTGFTVEALSPTNDNIAKLVTRFTCSVHIDIET